ncbi:GNAT family N-acetyltransferase [Pleurocapsales cyanobacterium LEGE 10410]|nr:GNAT family N-acetyltransferase [Pleurocapsales cyanobacterium LEGE 10410]
MLKVSQATIPLAAQILCRGFVDDPMLSFIFLETENKLDALAAFFQVFLADTVRRGEVLIAPDEKGAIAWYPSDVKVFDDRFEEVMAELAEVAITFGGLAAAERLEQIGKQGEKFEPKQVHCEVLWIALIPEARGKGIGRDLLSPVVNYADEQQVGCYLVSSTPRNISFYQRQGFRQISSIPTDSTLTLTRMWRDAVQVSK